MAVTIDELQVEVTEPAPVAATPASGEQPKKQVDLPSALELIRERQLRLRAD